MRWTRLNGCLKKQLEESNISTIYFTSTNGTNNTLALFKRWITQYYSKSVRIPNAREWRENGLEIELSGKTYLLEVLFSPSPSARINANRIQEYLDWRKNPKTVTSDFDSFRIDWYKKKLPKSEY